VTGAYRIIWSTYCEDNLCKSYAASGHKSISPVINSSHIKLVSTSPINKANIKIKIKANHENVLKNVLYSYQLHNKVK
jgi:hypothetical protein